MKQICLAFLAFATVLAHASPLPSAPHVYVEGSAIIMLEPDQMTITVNIEATEKEAGPAKKDVDHRTTSLLSALTELGIANADISSRQLRIGPAYEFRSGERERIGIRVSREVEVILRDLTLYSGLIAGLMEADISSIGETRFTVSNEEEILARASDMALTDARRRAEVYARRAGRTLGHVHSISEFQLRREESYRLEANRWIGADSVRAFAFVSSPPPAEPFLPGRISAGAMVYVVYLLGP